MKYCQFRSHAEELNACQFYGLTATAVSHWKAGGYFAPSGMSRLFTILPFRKTNEFTSVQQRNKV